MFLLKSAISYRELFTPFPVQPGRQCGDYTIEVQGQRRGRRNEISYSRGEDTGFPQFLLNRAFLADAEISDSDRHHNGKRVPRGLDSTWVFEVSFQCSDHQSLLEGGRVDRRWWYDVRPRSDRCMWLHFRLYGCRDLAGRKKDSYSSLRHSIRWNVRKPYIQKISVETSFE